MKFLATGAVGTALATVAYGLPKLEDLAKLEGLVNFKDVLSLKGDGDVPDLKSLLGAKTNDSKFDLTEVLSGFKLPVDIGGKGTEKGGFDLSDLKQGKLDLISCVLKVENEDVEFFTEVPVEILVLTTEQVEAGNSLVIVEEPSRGTLEISGDGTSFIYTGTEGSHADDTFTYEVQCEGNPNPKKTLTARVNMIFQNTAPVAADLTRFQISLNQIIDVFVLDQAFDIDGDALTVTAITMQPSAGSAEVVNGTFIRYFGQDNPDLLPVTIEYEISDGKGGTDRANITVEVPICFPLDSLIRLANGTDVPLASVTVDDQILCFPRKNNSWTGGTAAPQSCSVNTMDQMAREELGMGDAFTRIFYETSGGMTGTVRGYIDHLTFKVTTGQNVDGDTDFSYAATEPVRFVEVKVGDVLVLEVS
uniref:Cadherin-like domain-containing protein n=1 Tax=Chromera velia CCMP2878 TaxID=1169474 RepID=A0A0G4HZF3_9ALVE|eukprot:Cvel_33927.t1-p1 / transcript=Cvel_33927.t1 / gene=Cvel_33927 / organism=Chromera_velia_CCMP2878 / gene_product=hypothetical protein / transcript_product=hypothetical protein / location=Cvel_scaffold5662:461-4027(-) / protein_length=418 / sequence_SO=supercontig / SO=protein_coding / is_pseudo=false